MFFLQINTNPHTIWVKNVTMLLKVLSSEMDLAEITYILYVVIKGWVAEIFREIRQYPILWGRDCKKNTPDFKTDLMEIFKKILFALFLQAYKVSTQWYNFIMIYR